MLTETLANPRWLRSHQAARYLSVPLSTLSKRRLTGDGPPFSKFGRLVIYDRLEIDQWLADRSQHSTSDSQFYAEHDES
jgi:hypothetical protein